MLQKHILTTIAYYDVLDYPLTSFEIWKYLTTISKFQYPISNNNRLEEKRYSLHEIISELENNNLKKFIEEYRGFYFLKGRKGLVEQRMKRGKLAEEKYKILLKVAKILRFAPYMRMIAVTGRMAMKNTEEKSDLDLLVVLKHGKIFTGRTLVTLLVHLLGKRRYKGKIADRVCLNYFVTTRSLEINLKDLYASSEYYFIQPLFGFEVFHEFQAANKWIREYKINYKPDDLPGLKMLKDTLLTKIAKRTGEIILKPDFIEKILKNWQIKRIAKNPKTHQPGSVIMANDETLIFLPRPQGPKVYDKFQEKLGALTKA
jgi:predicted nucleotidyltransferase